nr:unnamed protein product [Haemonchus contortus]
MGPPPTRARASSIDSRADALTPSSGSDAPPSHSLADALSYLDDRASVRGRDVKVLRDATVVAISEAKEEAKADTTRLTHSINENNITLLADQLHSVKIPPVYKGIRPVLYQVVATGWGAGVILEAKDFFIMGPDRRDLHCITFDQYSIDVITGGRGFNKALLSIKDFVWVYSVKPTLQALESPRTTLQQASVPRTTVLETTSSFFFRVSHFAFAPIINREESIYGDILSRTTRYNNVIHARAALEGCPDAVTITPSICQFSLNRTVPFEILGAHSRVNVSSATRFCEPPVSLEARAHLAELIRCFLPMHPDEGILPLG